MIIEKLESYRQKHNITNIELANKLGIHEISWYRIKRTGRFNAKVLIRAQKILFSDAPKYSRNAPHSRQSRRNGGRIGEVISSIKSRIRDIPGHRPSSFLSSLG